MGLRERGEVSTRQPAQDTSLLPRQAEREPRAAGIMLLLLPVLRGSRLSWVPASGRRVLRGLSRVQAPWPLELLAGPLVKTPEGKLWPANWPEEASLR